MEVEEGSPIGSSKKHKKHKKKHKHRKESDHVDSAVSSPKTSIKLKLKIGCETMGTKNVTSIVKEPGIDGNQLEDKSQKKSGDKKNEDDISDEEKWLDALEKGTLDKYELSKKDPSLLTTRQKALLHGGQQDELMQLPSGYKTVELTEEQKKQRQEKAKRRRQQANEKIENDKNETVQKLLKKQESKLKRAGKPRGGKRSNAPRALYRNNADGISISFPSDISFPFIVQGPRSERKEPLGADMKEDEISPKTGINITKFYEGLAKVAPDAVALTSFMVVKKPSLKVSSSPEKCALNCCSQTLDLGVLCHNCGFPLKL